MEQYSHQKTHQYLDVKITDVCHYFIQNYIEYNTVKIQSFRSEENLVGPFTKNLSNKLFHSLNAGYVYCD